MFSNTQNDSYDSFYLKKTPRLALSREHFVPNDIKRYDEART